MQLLRLTSCILFFVHAFSRAAGLVRAVLRGSFHAGICNAILMPAVPDVPAHGEREVSDCDAGSNAVNPSGQIFPSES